jgi:Tfp pilus assembly PilM family ATPase
VNKVLVSGGIAKSKRILEIIREELRTTCETWNPFERCDIGVATGRKAQLLEETVNLSAACGAAIELIKGR